MADIVASITTAISLVSRLKKISENIKDAELKNLLADLSLELAEAKMRMANLLDENANLHNKIRELESAEGEPCPKCRKRTWEIEKTRKDGDFGDIGVIWRTYKCSLCGFTEEQMIKPK
ncbi:MAG TPA: hypothetical protein VJH03_12985 [Blastocatellia bacterium]|nr:hypothetical protein [Blastocatellia bacterium]